MDFGTSYTSAGALIDGRVDLIRDNGDADFLNIDALDLGADKSPDLAPHDCDHPDVAPIDDGA